MEEQRKKTRVALVRGDSLNQWEASAWEHLGPSYETVGVCSKKNNYDTSHLSLPIVRLRTSSDYRIHNELAKYISGQYKKMYGLESVLADIDIAHTAEIFNYYTLQAVRAKKKNPHLRVVVTVFDNTFGRFEYNYWPSFRTPPAYWTTQMREIIAECAEGVDACIVMTEASRYMLREYGVSDEKIHTVMPAIVMPAQEDDTSALRETHGLAQKEVYMMVSRLVKEKGVYEVLYGWRLYCNAVSDKNKVLLIIGNGKERDNMMRMVKQWGMEDQIRFIKRMPNADVRRVLSIAKALILGSLPNAIWQEQFGYVLAEAICNDCPVIGSSSGSIPEVGGDAGLYFSPGNAVALRDVLHTFDNKETYDSLKAAATKRKEIFQVDYFAERLKEIYTKVQSQ